MTRVELVESAMVNIFIYIPISYIQFLKNKGYRFELHYLTT